MTDEDKDQHNRTLVEAVRDGLLVTRVIMVCPDGKGVGSEHLAMSDVPDQWLCSCGSKHYFHGDNAEITFRSRYA